MRVTTDMGDWSTLPRRYRLAFVSIVVTGVAAAVAVLVGVLSMAWAAILTLNAAIALQWFLTRRRPWWRNESTTEPDLIDRRFGRRLALVAVVDAVALIVALATGR